MQLTNKDVQNRADRLGGCWKEAANIQAGCELLADNIRRLGSTRRGVRAYNGNTDAATDYATDVLKKQAVWHQRLKGTPAASSPVPDRPVPHKPAGKRPRAFKIEKRHLSGADVKLWQRTLNRQMRTWKVDYRIEEDGDYGLVTRSLTSTVLRGLGIAQVKMAKGVTPELRIKVRRKRLNPRERARYVARKPWRLRLRKKHAGGGGVCSPLVKITAHSNGFSSGHDGVDLICPPNAHGFAICKARVVRVSDSWWGIANPGGALGDRGDGIVILQSLVNIGPIRKGDYFSYGHAEKPRVKVGDVVTAGQRICDAGFANAWHFHFMWFRGNPGKAGGGGPKGIGNRDPMTCVRYAQKHS